MGVAEGGDGVAPPHAVGSRTHPLVGARNVVDQLARPEQAAEDLVHRGQLGQLAGTQRRQRLIGEGQSVVDAIGHHKQATEIGQRQELDVGVVQAATDRLAKQRLARLRVGFFEGLDDQHPTVLGSILTRLLEDGAGPCEPSASDGPVAEDVAGDPGERTCRPAGGHGVAIPTVDD